MRRFGVFLGVVVALALCAPLAASADPYVPPEGSFTEPELPEDFPACPAPVVTYEGEDGTVAELRALREEASQTCRALSGRLDLARKYTFWTLVQQVEDREILRKAPEEIEELLGLLHEEVETIKNYGTDPSYGGFAVSNLDNRGATYTVKIERTEKELEELEEGKGGGGEGAWTPKAIGKLQLAAQQTKEATEVGTEVVNNGYWILIGALLGCCAVAIMWKAFHGR